MKEQGYERILSALEKRQDIKRAVLFISRFTTLFMYLSYPAFLLVLFVLEKKLPAREILVPALAFILLSVFRAVLNCPRPYEKFDIAPLEKKRTSGRSFPSRHTFSAFMIAFTVIWRFPFFGSVLLIFSAALGICRILSGVHFIRDVIAGFLCAAAAGTVYIFI